MSVLEHVLSQNGRGRPRHAPSPRGSRGAGPASRGRRCATRRGRAPVGEAMPDEDTVTARHTHGRWPGRGKRGQQLLSQPYTRMQTPLSTLNLNSGLSAGTALVPTLSSELPARRQTRRHRAPILALGGDGHSRASFPASAKPAPCTGAAPSASHTSRPPSLCVVLKHTHWGRTLRP